jgi:hypothetical protein
MGHCQEYTWRQIIGELPRRPGHAQAFIGTAIGQEVEEAVADLRPGAPGRPP